MLHRHAAPILSDRVIHFIRQGQGFVLVYSIASRETFDGINAYHQAILKEKGDDPVLVLVGNQCDRIAERQVSYEEGAQLAETLGCEFFEVSAKTAHNVEEVFDTVVRLLRRGGPLDPSAQKDSINVNKRKKCIIM